MAIKDVKQYYYAMQAQYLEMKADLADFEEALAAGHITEDQLEAVKEDVFKLESNYDRLTYVMYLLEIPNRGSKKAAHAKANAKVLDFFEETNSSENKVAEENRSTLDHLRAELRKLKEAGN
jgi:hypothetical protein